MFSVIFYSVFVAIKWCFCGDKKLRSPSGDHYFAEVLPPLQNRIPTIRVTSWG